MNANCLKLETPITTPLHVARELIKERWGNLKLRTAVETALGDHMWPQMRKEPRGVMWRCLPSPDNGFSFFVHSSMWCGLKPFSPEYTKDQFIHLNEEKKGLARLCISSDNERVTCDILDWKENHQKPLNEAIIWTGQSLVEFHHTLFSAARETVERCDLSDWFIEHRPPKNYYYYYLAHFVAHGVLWETFNEGEDERNDYFTHEVIYPNIERIYNEFGVNPLIVQLYPSYQTPLEDFYWWSYPSGVNRFLWNWALENKIPIKPWQGKQ